MARPLEGLGAMPIAEPTADRDVRSSHIAELRSHTSALHGRGADLARLRAKLGADARLVTLFGPPGIGKTALALELARLETDARPFLFADLAEARDEESVWTAIERALNAPLGLGRSPSDQLADLLRADAPAVVVLDACDRVVGAVGALLRGVLTKLASTRSGADRVVFVVTSRELLGLTEEHAYEVGPLAVPAPGEHQSDAVALFLARIEQVRQQPLRPTDRDAIADIVRLLEGIPLALELAASRMSVLSPAALHARLASRLGPLTSRRRAEPPRARTMQAAIAWSFIQLEPYEQAALRQLCVFRGGFDAQSAEAVIDLSAHPGAPPVLEVVHALRTKSLVRGSEVDGEVRLGLYEVIREFGLQALRDANEEGPALARHAAYFVSGAIASAKNDAALPELTVDFENLLAVHTRALAGKTDGGPTDAFRILRHLEPVMWTSIPAPRSLALLDQAIACSDEVPAELRAEILLHRSRVLERMGRTSAREAADEALALARVSGDARLEASALARLGSIDLTEGEARRASNRLRQASAILVDLDPQRAANAFSALGTALRTLGEVEGARMAHEDALAIRARLGDSRGAGVDLACLGALHYQQGQLEQARALIEEAITRSRCFDDRYACAYATGVLGSVLAELGQLDEAIARYEEALQELVRLDDRRLHAIFLGYSAALRQLAGDLDLATASYSASLHALSAQGDRLHEGIFAGAASSLAWTRDDNERAELLYSIARDRLTELLPCGHARLTSALSLFLGHRDLAFHRQALRDGDDRTARAHADAARQRLADAASLADEHDDLRLAYRLLQKALDGSLPPPPDAAALEIEPDALWFRVGSRPRVDLRRRRALRLVLRALVAERLRAPGAPLPMRTLIEVGWPGEKMRLEAGMSRLYVTVRSLRELGLRSALLRQDDGYLLDPGMPLNTSSRPLDNLAHLRESWSSGSLVTEAGAEVRVGARGWRVVE